MLNHSQITGVTVNLCSVGAAADSLREFEARCRKIAEQASSYGPVDEACLGSEFCIHKLMAIPKDILLEKIAFLKVLQLRVLIMLPVIPERNWNYFMEFASEISGCTDGFVCNDWGTLIFLRRNYPNKEIVAGRLFEKGLRECRMEYGDVDENLARWTEKIAPTDMESAYLHLFTAYGISQAETDTPMNGSLKLADRIGFRVHYPRIYLSHSAICEFALGQGSASLCGMPCARYGKCISTDRGFGIYKIENCICAKQERRLEELVEGTYRLVYSPLLEVCQLL